MGGMRRCRSNSNRIRYDIIFIKNLELFFNYIFQSTVVDVRRDNVIRLECYSLANE